MEFWEEYFYYDMEVGNTLVFLGRKRMLMMRIFGFYRVSNNPKIPKYQTPKSQKTLKILKQTPKFELGLLILLKNYSLCIRN